MNIYIVVLIFFAIIILSNLLTFAAVRSSKGLKFGGINPTKNSLSQPFKKEEGQLNELRQRVEELTESEELEAENSKSGEE